MTAEHFDEAAYRQHLIDGGVKPETAHWLAQHHAEQVKQQEAQSQPDTLKKPEDQTTPDAANDEQGKDEAGATVVISERDRALVDAGLQIKDQPPTGEDMTFMHSIMCQIGMPRSKVTGLEFERVCGGAGLYMRAGKLWDGKAFVQQPLPYGSMPRLLMAYINTFALRNKTVEIEVGSSANEMLRKLGKESGGRQAWCIYHTPHTNPSAGCVQHDNRLHEGRKRVHLRRQAYSAV